jgi:hypothetical protein
MGFIGLKGGTLSSVRDSIMGFDAQSSRHFGVMLGHVRLFAAGGSRDVMHQDLLSTLSLCQQVFLPVSHNTLVILSLAISAIYL